MTSTKINTLEYIKTLKLMADATTNSTFKAVCLESSTRLLSLLSLIDGAYEAVELLPAPKDTYHAEWKKNWLKTARSYGAVHPRWSGQPSFREKH